MPFIVQPMLPLVRKALLIGCTALLAAACGGPASRATQAQIDFGLPSAAGRTHVGAAPKSFPVTLQLGLVANQKGIADAARSGSDPSSATYGHYPTLTELTRRWGAPTTSRRAVLAALREVGVRGTVDATGLRVTAPMTIGQLERLFARKWSLYTTGSAGMYVALPAGRPRAPTGLLGNVDTVAGLSPFVIRRGSSTPNLTESSPTKAAVTGSFAGGTPTRTGTVGRNCLSTADPAALATPVGLYPDQLLEAYGIASLHRQGLSGQGVKLAIVGEAATPLADVALFRSCFGFAGTPLRIHGGADVPPILESSLDAMVVSAVAPKLASFDLWVRPLLDGTDDGDVEGFLQLLAAPLEAARKGSSLPDVVSVSYGTCEAKVAPFSAARTLVERTLAAYASLGITVVVASGDSGSSTCADGVPAAQLTAADKKPYVSWPASSPWVLSVGGTNLTLDTDNGIASTGVWNDTIFPSPFRKPGGGGGGPSLFGPRPWWQPARSFAPANRRLVPDVAAFADPVPGYPIICSTGVIGCTSPQVGQNLAFVGGTSAATPLIAGMIALWAQRAREQGDPKVGFVPPLLYALAASHPNAFFDVTLGSNAIYDVACCRARTGYDLASGLGSPLADIVADNLPDDQQ